MSVEKSDILKLRPSVAVVVHKNFTEFFLTDLRKSFVLQMDESVAQFIYLLKGEKCIQEWLDECDIDFDDYDDCLYLLDYLVNNHILIKVDKEYDDLYAKYPRVYTLLEDYCSSQSEVMKHFSFIRNSFVMIIGLGSVGTWVSQCLCMSGVKHFILVDGDKVELSNLHRQSGFKESDIGRLKVDAFTESLQEMADVDVVGVQDVLDRSFFDRHSFEKIDLIINCADFPSVDETSRIVGMYSMAKGIPHIVGGGYNLHQTLIGQVVIPNKTACMECFRLNLDEMNGIDSSNITKLNKKTRKVGSFPPLSAIASSIAANEAIKILAKLYKALTMTEKRAEFSLKTLNFKFVEMTRRNDCPWCGKNGKYYQL